MSFHNFPAVAYHRPCEPQPCRVCGFDIGLAGAAGRQWRAVDTAAGLIFVCELHPASDVRDAVLSVELEVVR